MVQPERHPRHTNCHERWDVDGEDVVGKLKEECDYSTLKDVLINIQKWKERKLIVLKDLFLEHSNMNQTIKSNKSH